MKAWCAVVSLGLALSIAVGCGDEEKAGEELPPARGDLHAACSSTPECQEGLLCPKGGHFEAVCSVECDRDQDCKLHAGDEYYCLDGICAIVCRDECGSGALVGACEAGFSCVSRARLDGTSSTCDLAWCVPGPGPSGSGAGGSGNSGSGGAAGEDAAGGSGADGGGDGGDGGDGASGAGGGSEYECPETIATEASPLIDDFEDGDSIVASLDGRSGAWSASLTGVPHPVSVVSPGLEDSDFRLQVEWGPDEVGHRFLSLYFVEPARSELCVHDISAFTGLNFLARSSPTTQFFRVSLITEEVCVLDDCGDEYGWTFSTFLGVSPNGMSFDAFEKSSDPLAGPPDLSAIAGLRFDLSGIDEFEIDDLRFY